MNGGNIQLVPRLQKEGILLFIPAFYGVATILQTFATYLKTCCPLTADLCGVRFFSPKRYHHENGIFEYLSIAFGTFIICLLLIEFVIKKSNILRLLFGVKLIKKERAADYATRSST